MVLLQIGRGLPANPMWRLGDKGLSEHLSTEISQQFIRPPSFGCFFHYLPEILKIAAQILEAFYLLFSKFPPTSLSETAELVWLKKIQPKSEGDTENFTSDTLTKLDARKRGSYEKHQATIIWGIATSAAHNTALLIQSIPIQFARPERLLGHYLVSSPVSQNKSLHLAEATFSI